MPGKLIPRSSFAIPAIRLGRPAIWCFTAVLILLIAAADHAVGTGFSLGVLYFLPMTFGALALNVPGLALLALTCAIIRHYFDAPAGREEMTLRFAFAFAAYFCAGLLIQVRNRSLITGHRVELQHERDLRSQAERQMELLVASSSAAILTLDSRGVILTVNEAAGALLLGHPDRGGLVGLDIRPFLPILADAATMQAVDAPGKAIAFRTEAQCQGRRNDGGIFQAQIWFSSYRTPEGMRLAAIIVDATEEMREREGQKFREAVQSSRITAAALSHEIRNLCGAIDVLAANLDARHGLALDEDHRAMVNLVRGLGKVASQNLFQPQSPAAEPIDLRSVLDHLRIVVESDWAEIGAAVQWPEGTLPIVLADQHALLQVFLNLAKNSLRAVTGSAVKTLDISVSSQDGIASIRFVDSGCGVNHPERLFHILDPGSEGSGLGLYISRSLIRAYGGELRYQPAAPGASFVIELQMV